MATITAAVAKRGKDSCPLGGGVEDPPFRIQVSSGWLELEVVVRTEVPLAVFESALIPGGDRAPFLESVFGGRGKRTGARDREDKSHLRSTDNEPGIIW